MWTTEGIFGSWIFWLLVLLVILFVLRYLYGGKQYQPIGLTPLHPETDMTNLDLWTLSTIEPYGETISFRPMEEVEPFLAPEEIFEPNPSGILGEAPHRPRQSRGEAECCRVMSELYGVPFTTIRPDFLRNPETGRNLELDCYNEQLKIAVEYHGKQHYVHPNFTGQTKEQFDKQRSRDQLKLDLCDHHGVYVVTVPYTVPVEGIKNFIINELHPSLRPHTHRDQSKGI